MALPWWLPRRKPRGRQRRELAEVPGTDNKTKLQINLLTSLSCVRQDD